MGRWLHRPAAHDSLVVVERGGTGDKPEAKAAVPGPAEPGAQAPRIGEPSVRLECPVCGSSRTQPFLHAGPAARVNMKCLDCGNLFKDPHLRR